MSPTAIRRRVGYRLRELRGKAGMTTIEAAAVIGSSDAKISRLERGLTPVRPGDVQLLLDRYGGTDHAERDLLVRLAGDSGRRGWWQAYELPEWFNLYIGLESAASSICNFETLLIPGLLQTADYTRALVRQAHPTATAERVERMVDARLKRQDRLSGNDPLKLRAVVGEAALHCTVGTPDVMRAQFTHLARMSESPNIELRLVPFSSLAYAPHGRPVVILDFPEPGDPGLVYFDHLGKGVYVEDEAHIAIHRQAFELLVGGALTTEDSARHFADRG
ncbi:helix-turn-helix transcriptional regulator [Catellatospora sp. NPDC049111]|uniref:helix-turn-helix domain-containing protein n=1 Tax=Catellatospora sp. NPDC049111 TaxID=3155271 RepID=UPI003408E35E